MGRGKFYTEEENAALLELWKDKAESDNYADVAAKAKRYNLSPGRTKEAIAQQLSRLLKKSEAENEDELDPEMAIAKKRYDDLDRKYKSLIDAVIGTATLFDNNEGEKKNLKLNFRAIADWIWENEPEKAAARIEELGGKT